MAKRKTSVARGQPELAGLAGAFFLGLFLGIGATVVLLGSARAADHGGAVPAPVGAGADGGEAAPAPSHAGADGGGPVAGAVRSATPGPAATSPLAQGARKAPFAGRDARVAAGGFCGEVTRVVDGDTIHVWAAGKRWKIRYLGINTPESIAMPGRSVQYYGKEATRRNAAFVAGKTVRLEFDGPRQDRFGRWLCYVWVGETLVNRELLREGYAEVYRKAPKIRYWREFCALEQVARRRRQGMWARP